MCCLPSWPSGWLSPLMYWAWTTHMAAANRLILPSSLR